jgi:hypothetical protein
MNVVFKMIDFAIQNRLMAQNSLTNYYVCVRACNIFILIF